MTPTEHTGGFDASDEFARGIFDALAEGVLVVDHRSRIVAINPSAEQLLGFEPGELVGANVDNSPWILEDERGHELTSQQWPIAATMATGQPNGRLVVTVRPDLERRIIVMIAMPLRRPASQHWTVVSLMDVTRERSAELALAESERRFRKLVEQAPDPVLVVDSTGLIRSCNERTGAVFGYPCDDLVGMPIELLVPNGARGVHRDLRNEFLAAPTGRSMGAGADLSGRRSDGSTFPIEVSLAPIDSSDGPGVIAIARDLTERRQAQELVQVDRAKSEFLSRMSHELRTPLNSILGFAQLLDIAGPRPDQAEAIEQIQRAGNHLLELLNDLLEFERVRSGHVTFSIEPVSVRDAVGESLRLVEPSAKSHSVATFGLPANDDELWVSADVQRLRQVLLNLLSNAIKYNKPGGTVKVEAHKLGERIYVSVTDTGIGIPESRRANLFVPFERLGAENSPAVEGTGVGLALSRMLVEGMRGEITLTSTHGVGSTFIVSLPASEQPFSVAPIELTSSKAFDDSLRDVTVLCIEDNDANVRLIGAMLSMFGVTKILVARSAAEGTELARRHLPDVVLLDLHLPDGSGESVLTALRADPHTASMAFIVTTADANPATSRRLLGAGAHRYLTKPIDIHNLFDALVAATRRP